VRRSRRKIRCAPADAAAACAAVIPISAHAPFDDCI
jgi:hypothetical protein